MHELRFTSYIMYLPFVHLKRTCDEVVVCIFINNFTPKQWVQQAYMFVYINQELLLLLYTSCDSARRSPHLLPWLVYIPVLSWSIPMYYLYEHMNPMLLRTTHVINNQNRPETLRMSPILINIYVKKKGVFHLPKTLSGKCMASFQSW